ncbi:MAG TPA: hypothetical protein VMV69_03695 [Pirellulales bacterium]|nr:hypothetical protein [Pirellulales bacterium]
MFIRFLTTACAPDPAKSWSAGETRDVPDAQAEALIAKKLAEPCGTPKGKVFSLPDLCVIVERQGDRIKALETVVEQLVSGNPLDKTAWRKSEGHL